MSKQNNPEKKPALIKDRFELNGTQLADRRNFSAIVSFIFHFLGTLSSVVVSSYLNPQNVNLWLHNIFPDYIATLGGENTEERSFKIFYLFKTAYLNAMGFFLLEKISERLSLALYPHRSAVDPLDQGLNYDECNQEIIRLNENIKKNAWAFQLENRLMQDIGGSQLIPCAIMFNVFQVGIESRLNLSICASILAFWARSFYKESWLFLGKVKAHNKRTLFKPILDTTNFMLSQIPSIKHINLSFLEDSKEKKSLWIDEFPVEGITVIHNTGLLKNGILSFYVMLMLSALFKKHFDVTTLVIDKSGMIVNIDDAKVDEPRWWLGERIKDIISISLFNLCRVGYSTPQKIIDPFEKEADNRLENLTKCYKNIEPLKFFLKYLLGDAIPSENHIEVSYNPEINSFNTVMPFCISKLSFGNLAAFEKAMSKNNIRLDGISYYLLEDQLHIEHVNPWLEELYPSNVSEYYRRARAASGKFPMKTQRQDEKKSVPPSVTHLPEFKIIIDHKPSVIIERGSTFTNTLFFVPKKECIITHIEWTRHTASGDFKYYPLRNAGGKITQLALLLDMGEEINMKKVAKILDRGKVIRSTHTPGTYIRSLTANELADLKKTKPGIWTAAEKLYPEEKLKLTHKIHQVNHERIYGFTLENGAQVFYSNGETTAMEIILFCVCDTRSHKKNRTSGVFAAQQDPHYTGLPSKKSLSQA